MKEIEFELNGEAYSLRLFRPEYTAALQQAADYPEVARGMSDRFASPYTLADAEGFVNNVAIPSQGRILAIFAQERLIGGIGLHGHQDVWRYNMEIGYWLTPAFWGRGLMKKILPLFLERAWGLYPDLHRVEGKVFSFNMGSAKVLEATGFRLEGKALEAVYKSGQFWDEYHYALLRTEG